MGFLDKRREAAEARREAKRVEAQALEERERVEAQAREKRERVAARQREEAAAARKAEASLAPQELLRQPEWEAALASAGIEVATIGFVSGSLGGGDIVTAGSQILPTRREVGSGVILTGSGKIAYVHRSESGVRVLARSMSDVAEQRGSNSGNRFIIVFKGDRFFSHPNQQGRADHWDIRVSSGGQRELLAMFRAAGFPV